jgi:hypothetical protein
MCHVSKVPPLRGGRLRASRAGAAAVFAVLAAGAAAAFAAPALVTPPDAPTVPPPPPGTVSPGQADGALAVTEVKVESVKPKKTRHQTLRFLKDNKDFIRARLDLLRATTTERGDQAGEIDPRYLAYQRMMREALAGGDSVAVAEGQRQGLALLESVDALARLEAELDLMDSLLAGQRERLAILQSDFAGQQRTALLILLAGYPRSASISDLAVTLEDGTTVTVTIPAEQRQSLQQGGIAQLFYGLVEPREQVIDVTLHGEAWPGGSLGYVQIDPEIDRITLLKLDASSVDAGRGAPSLRAFTWLHEDRLTSAIPWSPAP